jgi:hypothetical protein
MNNLDQEIIVVMMTIESTKFILRCFDFLILDLSLFFFNTVLEALKEYFMCSNFKKYNYYNAYVNTEPTLVKTLLTAAVGKFRCRFV